MSSEESDRNDNGSEGSEGTGGGSENARDKRIRELEDIEKNHKKAKTSINAVAQEYTCPITHELMVDPVMAKDGHLYEREAIEETIRVQGNELKSPKTGLEMEPELLPAVTVKNTIEALVESGTIDGDLADHYRQGKLVYETKKKATDDNDIKSMQSLGEWYRDGSNGLPKDKELSKQWLEKATDVALVRDTTAKAEAGDVEAMYDLAIWNIRGQHGLLKSNKMALPWLEKGAELKHVPAMACYANFVTHGKGTVTKDVAYGVVLTMEAAMSGSNVACRYLGAYYSVGDCGMPPKLKEARQWLTKATDGSCAFKHASGRMLERAKNDLKIVIRQLDRQDKNSFAPSGLLL